MDPSGEVDYEYEAREAVVLALAVMVAAAVALAGWRCKVHKVFYKILPWATRGEPDQQQVEENEKKKG